MKHRFKESIKWPINFLLNYVKDCRSIRHHNKDMNFLNVERAEKIFYINYVQEDMIIFDVGANIGELSLLFSRFTDRKSVV